MLWLDELNLDKSALAQLLDEQFGLALDVLEASPPPTVFEVIGIEVGTQVGARGRRRGGGSMKAVILAGGLGTRLSEESHCGRSR